MDAAGLELVHIFEEARRRLEAPDNDYTWSSWEGGADALEEVDAILADLRAGKQPPGMSLMFAPTGPMQEVSLSSGWGDAFVELAERFDGAIAALGPPAPCPCLIEAARDLVLEAELGVDEQYGEVSAWCCSRCGQAWLRYFQENEAFSRSGRWYLGAITKSQRDSVRADTAKGVIESLDWYFFGGSYFDGRIGKASGPIAG